MAEIKKIVDPSGGQHTLADTAVRERVTALEQAGPGGTAKQYNRTLTLANWSYSS